MRQPGVLGIGFPWVLGHLHQTREVAAEQAEVPGACRQSLVATHHSEHVVFKSFAALQQWIKVKDRRPVSATPGTVT